MLFLFELEESFIPESPPSSPVKLLLLLLLLRVAIVVCPLMLLSVCVVAVVVVVAHLDCDEISGGILLSIINIPSLSLFCCKNRSLLIFSVSLCLLNKN